MLKRKSDEKAPRIYRRRESVAGIHDESLITADEMRRSLEIQDGEDAPERTISPACVFSAFEISRLHGPPSSDYESIYYTESEETEMASSKSVSPEKPPSLPRQSPPPENPDDFVDLRKLERQRVLYEFWYYAKPITFYKEVSIKIPEFHMMRPEELRRHDRDIETYCGRQIYVDGLLDPLRNLVNVKEYERRNNLEAGFAKEIVAELRRELNRVLYQPLEYVVERDRKGFNRDAIAS